MKGQVLVVGVVLVDRLNTASAIADELSRSNNWDVRQRWVALGATDSPRNMVELVAPANAQMAAYLPTRPHVSTDQAFVILESYG